MCDLIVSVPDHGFSFYFSVMSWKLKNGGNNGLCLKYTLF